MVVMHVELIGLPRLRTSKTSVDVEVADASVASLIRALAAACPALAPDVLTPDPPAFVGGHGLVVGGAVVVNPAAKLSGDRVTLLSLPAGG